MNILFNIGTELTAEEQQRIHKACPEARLRFHTGGSGKPIEGPPTERVDVLASEFPPQNIAEWKGLQFFQCVAAGINHFSEHPVWETSIPVATASGIHSVPMAEFATCGLLMLAHRFPQLANFKSSRQWPDRVKIGGECLRGKTVGIVGYGSIGRESARQASVLGMRVVCLKRNPEQKADSGYNGWPGTGDPSGAIPERWFAPAQLHQMLPECDALIVTAPRTKETENLIRLPELKLLRPGAYVVITSRGGIVNETDLAAALRTKVLGGALVDCYHPEPPAAENPFFDLDNIILTPHMSGVFGRYWDKFVDLFCENLRRWTQKKPLLNLANRTAGY